LLQQLKDKQKLTLIDNDGTDDDEYESYIYNITDIYIHAHEGHQRYIYIICKARQMGRWEDGIAIFINHETDVLSYVSLASI
jgi:hypothetical protein